MHMWSPTSQGEVFYYFMNAVAQSEHYTSRFVDGKVTYRMFRDSTGYSCYASSEGSQAGIFSRIGYSIALVDGDTNISLEVVDAPKEYNIPTGVAKYDIVRDYAGYPGWLKVLIKVGSWLVDKLLDIFSFAGGEYVKYGLKAVLELLKSGVP